MHSRNLTAALLIAPALASPYHSRRHSLALVTSNVTNGAVSSESAICSRVGTDILFQGGNAADAMVATVFCTGVIGMYHSGVGGGGFATVRSANGSYDFVDFREASPIANNETVFVGNVQGSLTGGLASGVPGEVRGMEYLHAHYGSMAWEDLITPAVNIARYGFPVSQDLVNYIASAIGTNASANFLVNDPAWALDFAPNGTLLGLGEILTRKRYADTLETIGQKGPDSFYTGAIATTMLRALRATNGTMTQADLDRYSVMSREPSQITYRGYKITSSAAPASGAIALSSLKILEGYSDFFDGLTALNLSTHRLIESFRFAYGQRTLLGDPSFIPGLQTYQSEILSADTAAIVRSRISDTATQKNASYYDPANLEIKETPGTSHIVTTDSTGLSLSLTTTVNLLFGSKLIIPETGIIMNNEMNDFSIPGQSNAFGFAPSANNYVRPGARPLSSISPTIVEDADGQVVLITGSAGGSRIITTTAQQVIFVLDRNMAAAEALAEKRAHDQLVPNVTELEQGYDAGVAEFLKERGHNVSFVPVASTSAQSIKIERGLAGAIFEAASEPRQLDSGGYVV